MGADIGPPQTTSPATFASRAISSRRATIARYTPRPRNLARTAPPLMIAPLGGYKVRPALPAGSPAIVARMTRLFPEIGRASCRERGELDGVGVGRREKRTT